MGNCGYTPPPAGTPIVGTYDLTSLFANLIGFNGTTIANSSWYEYNVNTTVTYSQPGWYKVMWNGSVELQPGSDGPGIPLMTFTETTGKPSHDCVLTLSGNTPGYVYLNGDDFYYGYTMIINLGLQTDLSYMFGHSSGLITVTYNDPTASVIVPKRRRLIRRSLKHKHH